MNRRKCLIASLALCAACSESTPSVHGSTGAANAPPATLDSLATITLRPEALRALELKSARVEMAEGSRSFVVGGEVMVPAGQELIIAAPTSGRITAPPAALPRPGDVVTSGQALLSLVPLASVDRDIRARAARELETARADLSLTDARLARAEAMAAGRSGSQRALDEAKAQQHVATAAVNAAEARLRTISKGSLDADVVLPIKSSLSGVVRAVRVTLGQSVPQGAPLFEIAGAGRWVRATFAASDAQAVGPQVKAVARRVGRTESVELNHVQGPPSADAVRGTIDQFFTLPEDADWPPGERVSVEVAVGAPREWTSVPFTSVVRDAEGGTWVYEKRAPDAFRRRRVEPSHRNGDRWLLVRGPKVGTEVVAQGAIELWGYELGADR